MPSNRGAHPEDDDLFAPSEVTTLRSAVRDLSWLRTRGYGDRAAQKIVGDRYRLKRRQRNAVARSACSDQERRHRLEARRTEPDVDGEWLHVDTFNVLITLETALGGGYVFVGRDTTYRDVDPVKGTYRVVRQTDRALDDLAAVVDRLGVKGVRWLLDASVSNAGRIKTRLGKRAPEDDVAWETAVRPDVDAVLSASEGPVVTSDSSILDAAEAWFHLEAVVHRQSMPDVNLVDLRPDGERSAW